MLNELFIVLLRMRLALFEIDLAHRIDVHVFTVNQIPTSWINFMNLKSGYLNIWPNRDSINKVMSQPFEENIQKKSYYRCER